MTPVLSLLGRSGIQKQILLPNDDYFGFYALLLFMAPTLLLIIAGDGFKQLLLFYWREFCCCFSFTFFEIYYCDFCYDYSYLMSPWVISVSS